MPARSAVEKLPEDVRKNLEGWLGDFKKGRLSLDEVMTRLSGQLAMNGIAPEEGPSRSSVHRHAEKFAKLADRLKQSEQMAAALAREVGPQVADGQGMRVLVQAFQSLAFDMIGNLGPDESLDAENLMFLARSIQAVAGAQKTDADRALKIAQEERKRVAADVTQLGKKLGWTKETARQVRAKIFGVDIDKVADDEEAPDDGASS